MINDATKKYRELMGFGLLAAAALGLISALSLLFKSGDDLGSGVGFSEKSAAFGYLFESWLVVLALVGAVVLVTRLGDLSASARIVVLAAMGIGGVDVLFAVITFFAQFGADSQAGVTLFGGVLGAGKTVGVLLGLAHLIVLLVALLFLYTAFQSLPAPAAAPASQWGVGPGVGQYGAQQPPGAPGQQPWQQPDQGYGQQGWAQPGQPYPGQTQQPTSSGWTTPAAGQQGWAAPAASAQQQPSAPAWPQPDPPGWGQPQAQPQANAPAPPEPPATASSPWATEPERPAPFWGPPEVAHVQPPDVPDSPQATEPALADVSDPGITLGDSGAAAEPAEYPASAEPAPPTDDLSSDPEGATEASGSDAPRATEASGSDTPGTDQDDRPPGQGWWRHPGE